VKKTPISGLCGMLLVALASAAAGAPIEIDLALENYQLQPDAPDQTILISVSDKQGGTTVSGVNFRLRLDDGISPGDSPAPRITAIDLIGDDTNPTIFYGNANPPVDPDGEPDAWPYYEARIVTTAAGSVPADGLLAIVTLDATGVFSGSWDLILGDPGGFPTSFPDAAVDLEPGTLHVVPEPATLTLLLIAAATLACWLCKAPRHWQG